MTSPKSETAKPKTFDEIRAEELGAVVGARHNVSFEADVGALGASRAAMVDRVRHAGFQETTEAERVTDVAPMGDGAIKPKMAEVLRALPPAARATASPSRSEAATVGLALSGGGIRSATFSLGVLQLLAARKQLHAIDYLSSVSGGGYIASWLSAWIARTDVAHVEEELAKSPETRQREPSEVLWLRRYSNYLTPRVGALSLDALTVVSTYLRNVLLNMIILVFGVGALLALPIAAAPVIGLLALVPRPCAFVALALALVSLSFVAINLAVKCPTETDKAPYVFSARGVFGLVVLPSLGAGLFGGVWLLSPAAHEYEWWQSLGLGLFAFYVVVGCAWAIALRVAAHCRSGANEGVAPPKVAPDETSSTLADGIVYAACAAFAALVGAGLLIALKLIFRTFWPIHAPPAVVPSEAVAMFLFGPAGILLCLGIAASIFIGLVGRRYAEGSREWFARTGGTFLMTSLFWIVWLGLSFYVPPLVDQVIGPWLARTALASWLGSLIGSMVLTRARGTQKAEEGTSLLTLLATVLATIVACGLLVLISIGVHVVLGRLYAWIEPAPVPAWGRVDIYSAPLRGVWPSIALLFTLGAAAVALLFAWRVDVNRFSLHDMYKNRLIRCYLGATNRGRRPRPFVGFDTSDDLPLTGLPKRPHHIINTALNLVQGSELAWQERKAASFVMMRNYCGFQLSQVQGNQPVRNSATPFPGMRPTSEYAKEDPDDDWPGMTLGTAMAISGAAMSPNMGFHSQPALAALMTFFNVRLGRWCPNPAGPSWQKSSPAFGLRYLVAELTGNTNESSDFVYLSDGGHFENTGVYELVRRRCARIVVVDVGADPARAFEDLANMLRKCRVDLGVDFDLEASALYGNDDGPRSKAGFVFGTIFYGAEGDRPAFAGRILVIKPSLQQPPGETTDIYSYAKRAAEFPQQTTVDQWFDESQFESYRKLGYCLAASAFDSTEAKSFFPTVVA